MSDVVSRTAREVFGLGLTVHKAFTHTSGTYDDPKWNVRFRLYTEDDDGVKITKDTDLSGTDFDPDNPTKVIVHGFNSSAKLSYLVDIREEYFKRGNCNIITVDYKKRAKDGDYLDVYTKHAGYVGSQIARIVKKLRKAGAEDIHMIGFSLGCHIIGKAAAKLEPYRVKRVTALDPAILFIVQRTYKDNLRPGNADFVDVYHTNTEVSGEGERLGHIDVYINGGAYQPGCRTDPSASHHRAIEYYAESINSKTGFWGTKSEDWLWDSVSSIFSSPKYVKLGARAKPNLHGYYVMTTNEKKPYAKRP